MNTCCHKILAIASSALVIAVLAACVVVSISIDGLPCGSNGECFTGYKCYKIPGQSQPSCLLNGEGYEPFQPNKSVVPVEPIPTIIIDSSAELTDNIEDKECYDQVCIDISCQPKKDMHEKRCVGNAVYWFDDCGEQGVLAQTCREDQTCINGQCLDQICKPQNHTYEKRCVGNAVYWFDNCGNQGSLIQACSLSQSCKNGVCLEKCQNPCQIGQTQCIGDYLQSCIFNAHIGCYEWGNPELCPPKQKCKEGSCVPDPALNERNCKISDENGQCKDDTECCKDQTCNDITVFSIKVCGPCKSNADCPTTSNGKPLVCCIEKSSNDSFCTTNCF